MIHSVLISGGDSQKRWQKANELGENFLSQSPRNHPDFLLIEAANSIKISQIRQLQKKLSLKPYQASVKVAVINEAEKLTLPAQHSLLKTLEEPPPHSIVLLLAPTKEMLLPTIVSRCQVIQLPAVTQILDQSLLTSHFSLLTQILSSSPGQRLLIAEQYIQNREQATEFCQTQLIFLRELLRQKIISPVSTDSTVSTDSIVKTIRHLQQALSLLKSNVNHRLILENLLLSYPI